ncbi:metallophosphoesterase [Amycolatopsis taiwanensis]|uniref:metallophosphoesterase n=1 Tax=Amycolatopsis taiwanensis TaxID=342230 RepID=UPI000484825E|nr:metallophosphoesterase [Amycolatopsis taiwanensis]
MPFYHTPLAIGLSLLHVYVWWRVVKQGMAPGPRRRIVTGLLIVLDLFMVAALLLSTRMPPSDTLWFAWPGWVWFGMFFYGVLVVLVLEIPRLFLRGWVRRDRDPDKNGISRRQFLARGTGVIAGVTAVAAAGFGIPAAFADPRMRTVRIRLPRLDPKASGCRIALVSDLHLGSLRGRGFTQRVVDMINDSRPDIVAIAGDLVEGTVDHLSDAVEPVRELRSTHGTFFVTGNHEYHYRYTEWVDYVRTLGVRPLLNERTTITHNGGQFELAGVLDPGALVEDGQGPDVARTLRGWDKERAMVLLAHQPSVVHDAAAAGVDLQLSGHTHGGQIAPFNLLVAATQVAVSGLSTQGDTQLYVTSGAGFYGPPMRVGAPSDITIVELHSD